MSQSGRGLADKLYSILLTRWLRRNGRKEIDDTVFTSRYGVQGAKIRFFLRNQYTWREA